MKATSLLIILFLVTLPVFGQTIESSSLTTAEVGSQHNFWQEFDIAFWQTLPWATLWGHFIDQKLSQYIAPTAAEPHWNAIIIFAAIVSTGNAFIHADDVLKNERTRDRH